MLGKFLGKSNSKLERTSANERASLISEQAFAFGDRFSKRYSILDSGEVGVDSCPSYSEEGESIKNPASYSEPSQTQYFHPSSDTFYSLLRQAASQAASGEQLYSLVPELRYAAPGEIFKAYYEARRSAGKKWTAIMKDLGVVDDSSPEEKKIAAKNAKDHPLYSEYLHARAIRDAAVLLIAACFKTYGPFIGQNPHSKIAFEADLRVALGQHGVRQAEQKLKSALTRRYGPSPTARQKQEAEEDPSRLKPIWGVIANINDIQHKAGVVGTIVQDHNKGPIDIVAFDKTASFLRKFAGKRVKILGSPFVHDPTRLRVYFVFLAEKAIKKEQSESPFNRER